MAMPGIHGGTSMTDEQCHCQRLGRMGSPRAGHPCTAWSLAAFNTVVSVNPVSATQRCNALGWPGWAAM